MRDCEAGGVGKGCGRGRVEADGDLLTAPYYAVECIGGGGVVVGSCCLCCGLGGGGGGGSGGWGGRGGHLFT